MISMEGRAGLECTPALELGRVLVEHARVIPGLADPERLGILWNMRSVMISKLNNITRRHLCLVEKHGCMMMWDDCVLLRVHDQQWPWMHQTHHIEGLINKGVRRPGLDAEKSQCESNGGGAEQSSKRLERMQRCPKLAVENGLQSTIALNGKIIILFIIDSHAVKQTAPFGRRLGSLR